MNIIKVDNNFIVTKDNKEVFCITESKMIEEYGDIDNFIKSIKREVVLETLDIDLFENLLAQLEYINMVEG